MRARYTAAFVAVVIAKPRRDLNYIVPASSSIGPGFLLQDLHSSWWIKRLHVQNDPTADSYRHRKRDRKWPLLDIYIRWQKIQDSHLIGSVFSLYIHVSWPSGHHLGCTPAEKKYTNRVPAGSSAHIQQLMRSAMPRVARSDDEGTCLSSAPSFSDRKRTLLHVTAVCLNQLFSCTAVLANAPPPLHQNSLCLRAISAAEAPRYSSPLAGRGRAGGRGRHSDVPLFLVCGDVSPAVCTVVSEMLLACNMLRT